MDDSDSEQPHLPATKSLSNLSSQHVILLRAGVCSLFDSVVRYEIVLQRKEKSSLIFWHKAFSSINIVDTIEEFKQQEQLFAQRGIKRKKNNYGHPRRSYTLDGIQYVLKWFVFSVDGDDCAASALDRATCPLYLFVGNTVIPGYAYCQVSVEGVAANALLSTNPAVTLGDELC